MHTLRSPTVSTLKSLASHIIDLIYYIDENLSITERQMNGGKMYPNLGSMHDIVVFDSRVKWNTV
jgi:hypothetical protein